MDLRRALVALAFAAIYIGVVTGFARGAPPLVPNMLRVPTPSPSPSAAVRLGVPRFPDSAWRTIETKVIATGSMRRAHSRYELAHTRYLTTAAGVQVVSARKRAPYYQRRCLAGDPAAPPRIDLVRGPIQSGGILIVEGDCFGDATGQVEINGLPVGTVKPVIKEWKHDTITAVIPSLTKVFEQPVTLTVDRRTTPGGLQTSNVVDGEFLPETEERAVPAAWILNRSCLYEGQCANGHARHSVVTDNPKGQCCVTGRDLWEVKAPPAWDVEAVGASIAWGLVTIGDDFQTCDPTDCVFTIQWSDALYNRDRNGLRFLTGGDLDKWVLLADYTLSVTVVGPKGTWPGP
jgi:hypothetical protein